MAFSIPALLSGRRRHATVPLAVRAYHRPSVTMKFTVKTRATMFAPQPAWSAPPRLRPHSLFVAIALPPTRLGCRLDRSRRHQLWLRWPVHAVRQVCALVISIALPSRTTGIPCVAASFRSVSPSPSPSPSGAQTLVTVSSGRAPRGDGVRDTGSLRDADHERNTNSGRDTAPY